MNINIKVKSILILLTIIVCLFFINISKIKPISVDIEDSFGLLSKLSMFYWLGFLLLIMVLLFILNDKDLQNNTMIVIYALIVTSVFLLSISMFAETNTRNFVSYYPPAEVKNVIDSGYIDTFSEYPVISYRYWIGIHVISAFVMLVSNVDLSTLIHYMPLLWIICYPLLSFSLGKKLDFGTKNSFLLSIFILSSFWTYYYYNPQLLAFILYTLFFLFYFAEYRHKNLILIMIFVAITITHLLTSLALLIPISMIGFLRKKEIKLPVLMFIIFLSWYIYISPTIFTMGIKRFILELMTIEQSMNIFSSKIMTSAVERRIAGFFLKSYVFIYYGLTLFIISEIVFKNKQVILNLKNVNFLYWIIGLFPLYVLRYGSEIYERIYIFSLIPMSIIIISRFSNAKKILSLLMVVFITFQLPINYITESFMMTYTTELKGSEFFSKHVDSQDIHRPFFYQFGQGYTPFYNPKSIIIPYARFSPVDEPNIYLLDDYSYVINSRQTRNIMMYNYGFDPIQNWIDLNTTNSYVVYTNEYYSVFKNELFP